MKEKIYASFIITNIDNKEYFQKIENYILNKFEYSEIILIFNDGIINIDKIRKELEPKSDNIICINLKNENENNTIRAGLEFSKGDIVFVVKDITINNLENYLDNLYEKNKNGIDCAFLTTHYKGLKDSIFINTISTFSKIKFNNIYDISFFVTRRMINAISENTSKTLPLSYIIRNIGYSYYEISSDIKNHKYKLTKQDRSAYLLIFSESIANISFIISLFSMFIVILAGIYSLLLKLLGFNPPEGWSSIFVLLSFGFTFIFVMFSIIFRYLGMISKELENKPVFKVISIIKL